MLEGKQFAVVRVRVNARTVAEAFEKASTSLDFIRGAWNFSLNRGLWEQGTTDSTQPVNQVLPGPVHTLHNPDGSKATEMFWFEPFFEQPAIVKRVGSEWARVKKEESLIRSTIRNSSLGDALRS